MGENTIDNCIRIDIKEKRFVEVYWENKEESKVIVNLNDEDYRRMDGLTLGELIKILEEEKSKIIT